MNVGKYKSEDFLEIKKPLTQEYLLYNDLMQPNNQYQNKLSGICFKCASDVRFMILGIMVSRMYK